MAFSLRSLDQKVLDLLRVRLEPRWGDYLLFYQSEVAKRLRAEQEVRKSLFRTTLAPSNLQTLDQDQLADLLKHLFSSRYPSRVSRLAIESNDLEDLKWSLHDLLWGQDDLPLRFDSARRALRGLGTASLTEILYWVHPDQCFLCNRWVESAFHSLGLWPPSAHLEYLSGFQYLQICEGARYLMALLPSSTREAGDFTDVDCLVAFLHYHKSQEQPESPQATVVTPKVTPPSFSAVSERGANLSLEILQEPPASPSEPGVGRVAEAPPLEWSRQSALEQLSRETYLPRKFLATVERLIRSKGQLILKGPPGTGKTFLARKMAQYLAGPGGLVTVVQFHPSYTYEDFIEGIRPQSILVQGQYEVSYPVQEGVFLQFCRSASQRPDTCVLVIDEINRGDLPRIFGELLYSLEYRGESVLLPYSHRSFILPSNVLILGTMNTADRSAGSLDLALQRRFAFVELRPDVNVLKRWLKVNPVKIPNLLEYFHLSQEAVPRPEARPGHGFFMVPGLDEKGMELLWCHTIYPYLASCLWDQPNRAEEFRWERVQKRIQTLEKPSEKAKG